VDNRIYQQRHSVQQIARLNKEKELLKRLEMTAVTAQNGEMHN